MINLWLGVCIFLCLGIAAAFCVGFYRRRYVAQLVIISLALFVASGNLREMHKLPNWAAIPIHWAQGFILALGFFFVWNSERQRP